MSWAPDGACFSPRQYPPAARESPSRKRVSARLSTIARRRWFQLLPCDHPSDISRTPSATQKSLAGVGEQEAESDSIAPHDASLATDPGILVYRISGAFIFRHGRQRRFGTG
jgi:hypothetical protein